jgi:RNA polymerase sporulation-specific sigma factor
MDDLFQIGVVGLIKSVENFDLKFDVKFSTYAVFMIEGEIKDI